MTFQANKKIAVSAEVSAGDIVDGIFQINGTISYDGEAIEFVYQTKNVLGTSSEKQSVRILLSDLQEIEYKSNVVSTRVILLPRRLGILNEIPGTKGDKMIFQVKRESKKHADEFVLFIKSQLFELGQAGGESVPFQLKETNMGMTEHSGLLYLDEEFLVFDLQSGIAGLVKRDSQIVKIEPGAIISVRFERGTIKDALYIEPKSDALLTAIPGEFKTEVKLKIAKRDRQAAERLVGRIRHRMK